MYVVQYKSYTDKTLCYIQYTLYQINQTKGAFRDACLIDAIIKEDKNK